MRTIGKLTQEAWGSWWESSFKTETSREARENSIEIFRSTQLIVLNGAAFVDLCFPLDPF